MLKTYSTKASDIKRGWHIFDASDEILGKLATQIASLLMGKHKPIFSRHLDTWDFVVVINAEKVRVTGNKSKPKLYYQHSSQPGGLKSISLGRMLKTHPTRVIEYAVKGMLPHNRLQAKMMKRLRIHVGDAHPYQGQIKATSVKVEEKEA